MHLNAFFVLHRKREKIEQPFLVQKKVVGSILYIINFNVVTFIFSEKKNKKWAVRVNAPWGIDAHFRGIDAQKPTCLFSFQMCIKQIICII